MSEQVRKLEVGRRGMMSGGLRAGLWALLAILIAVFGCARPVTTSVGSVAGQPAEPRQAQPSSLRLPVAADDIVWGSAAAPVTIVAFLDFECPFCAQVHNTLLELLSAYGPTKLRLVVKHAPLPFHRRGVPAAKAAQAAYGLAGSSLFLDYVKQVFEHPDALEERDLVAWASELGIPTDKFTSEMHSASVQAKVEKDLELAETVGVNGVPAFYVNGAAIVGARPKQDFVVSIEHELRASEELLRRGVAADAVYAERVAVNFAAQPEEPKPYEDVAYQVPVGNSPVIGPNSAPVTIVEFADFECPFCRHAHETLESLMTKYPNQVRWVMKHNPLPFHPLALPASTTALEVRKRMGDAAYWQVLRQIYAAPSLSIEGLLQIAQQFGLEREVLEKAWKASPLPPELQTDQDLAMDLNAMGTPHFFINGRRMAGAQPLALFEEVVQQELQRVAALGTLPEPYLTLQQSALTPPGLSRHDVPEPSPSSPTLGEPSAQVVIQMFADFECAYCVRAVPTLSALRAKFPGKIKLVWRHLPLPFHHNARRAAAAALEAQAQLGHRGFWQMAEKLTGLPNAFGDDVSSLAAKPNIAALSSESITAAARDLGLDESRFAAALDSGAHEGTITADQLVAKRLGVQGTPAFFVGPYSLEGAQPLPRFERLVRRVLEELKQN